MEAGSIIERPDASAASAAQRDRRAHCTASGPRWRPRGPSTRTTSTRGLRASRRRCSSACGPSRASTFSSSPAARAARAGRSAARRARRRGGSLRRGRRDDRDRRGEGGRAGLRNVRAIDLDIEDIAQPDASYDVVLCREGLMFATDRARVRARSDASCGPAGGQRSPSGARASATPGSGWCSTRSARRSEGRCRRPACRHRSRSATATNSSDPPRRGLRAHPDRRAGDASTCRVLRGVVGADVCARRSARVHSGGAPRAGPRRAAGTAA